VRSVHGGGKLTTIEGLVREIITDLDTGQEARKVDDVTTWQAIDLILTGLRGSIGSNEDVQGDEGHLHEIGKGANPFTVVLDDPAGNSFVEFVGNMSDPKWNLRTYTRTLKDEVDLGLVPESDDNEKGELDDDVMVFPGVCSSCRHSLETRMKKVSIPYFKVCLHFSALFLLHLTSSV
jgi:zinc finger protein